MNKNLSVNDIEKKILELEKENKRQNEELEVMKLMAGYTGRDELISIHKIKEILKKENVDIDWSIKTGFPTLDKVIGGFRPGELVVVSAPTGHGKTTWCESVTKNISDNINSLWLSYEVGYKELIERFGDKLPNFYVPKELTDRSSNWIDMRIMEGISKYDIRTVFIDHLHYLFDMSVKINASLHLGSLVRQLKRIAVDRKIVIFLIAHIGKVQDDKIISINDIRDSSFIAQEADFVVLLQREVKTDIYGGKIKGENTKLYLQKNRRTGEDCSFVMKMFNRKFEEICLK